MFIGREKELIKLNQLYNSNKFEMTVIYGRRRIGKTTLINEFVKDKPTIYFTGVEVNEKVNLENFSQSIFEYEDNYTDSSPVFNSFDDAFRRIFKLAENQRVILIIDEYPYLYNAHKAISSILQKYIDQHKDNSKLFLILCGSSVSFMENQVLGYKSPLFGRRTSQMKVEQFEFSEARQFFKKYNKYDAALTYGITGGIPLYMTKIDDSLSVEENIKRNFLDSSAYLYDEPTNLVKQECREPAQYNSIIQAIAKGASRLSEISSKIGTEKTSVVSLYLKTLIEIGIVKKEYPYNDGSKRKTIYSLNDTMFRFWYRFVPSYTALINKDQADIAYKLIEPQLASFMGFVFEDICKQYLWQQNIEGKLPITFINLGRWWGNDPIRKSETEIDIVASDSSNGAILAECKWTNEPVSKSVLDDLINQGRLFNYKPIYYYVFSKSGFTKSVEELAEQLGNVYLISFDDMYK